MGAVTGSGKWSEYMQGSSTSAGNEDDDSPWSSLDAFVDNPEASAEFAVPFNLGDQHRIMQLSAQQYNQPHQPAQQYEPYQPQQQHFTAGEAFAANDDFLRQQAQLQSEAAEEELDEEKLFAQAGAAAVANLFPSTPASHSSASAPLESDRLSHVDAATGSASMVDVSSKNTTSRSATAVGRVYLPSSAAALVRSTETQRGVSNKGPVLHTAQLAGIMAAKRTSDLIPLCHPLPLTHVEVNLSITDGERGESWIEVECTAKTAGQTGVEMEALTGCMGACLTVWDMVKAVAGKSMRIGEVMVVRKEGGKSGDWVRAR